MPPSIYYIYITFSHLADAFIQSDLQMRTLEASSLVAYIISSLTLYTYKYFLYFFYFKKTSR